MYKLINFIEEGIVVIDLEFQILDMNKFLYNLLEIKNNDLKGKSIFSTIKDPSFYDKLISFSKNNPDSISSFEITYNNKSLKVLVTRDSNNDNIYYLLIKDTAPKKELEETKKVLLNNISHDFKTPLTSIIGFSEILINKKDIKEKNTKKFLSYINTNSKELANILEKYLTIL